MWLHVPPTSSSAPGSAEYPSPSNGADWSLCVALSGKHTRRPFSWRGWKTRPWVARLCGTISRPSTASRGADAWISSLRASRASRSASLASDSVPTMSAPSGPRSSVSSASASRRSSSSRTSSPRLFADPGLDFIEWALSSRRCVESQPRTLEPRIDECDSSRWPTATAQDSVSSGKADYHSPRTHHGTTLNDAVKAWSTPKGSDAAKAGPNMRGSKGDIPLPGQVAKWATPLSRDARSDCLTDNRHHSPPLGRQVLATLTPGDGGSQPVDRPRLNPEFVEALMGFPRDWTACAVSETPSCQSAPSGRSVGS